MASVLTARALLVLGPILLVGCGTVAVDDGLTLDEARSRVVAVATDAAQALPPGTTLVLARAADSFTDDDPPGPTGCRPAGLPEADPVAVDARWSSSTALTDGAAVLIAVAARWEADGREVTRPDASSVRTTVDGVVATVQSAPGRPVGITVVSPCFHPGGGRTSAAPLPTRLPAA